jgi:hypothetical protein
MVSRKASKDVFVEELHNWIKQYSQDRGIRAGLPADQVKAIVDEQDRESKILCGHIYDFLRLEQYIEN